MKVVTRITGLALLVAVATMFALAQRPRTVNDTPESATPQPSAGDNTAVAAPPTTFRAKYEGGFFGYNKKEDGTLTFEDINSRLVFRDTLNKERLQLPYASITAAYGDTKSLQPAAASIASAIPLIYTLPARFIKKKYRYLTMQFNDPDTNASGLTSFKVENQEILASVLVGLANKAGLSPRGDGFVRQPKSAQTASAPEKDETVPTVQGGVLNSRAAALPRPDYPQSARDANVVGTVTVQVTVNEEGRVIDATAVNGDPMLHDAAIAAARKAKFPPTTLAGRPVRVIGVINYDFVL
jgi:TonB family protein